MSKFIEMLKGRVGIITIICLICILFDMLTKFLTEGVRHKVIEGVVSFVSVHNTGAAWSIFSEHTILLTITSIIFLGLFFIIDHMLKRPNNLLYVISFSLIVGGGIGNLIDRIFFGYVRDFICLNFIDFPIFNIADICLCIGVGLIIIYILFDNIDNKKDEKKMNAETDTKTLNEETQKNEKE